MTLPRSLSVDLSARPGMGSQGRSTDLQAAPTGVGSGLRQSRARIGRRVLPWIVPGLLLLAWQGSAATGALPAHILPSPGSVARAAVTLAQSGDLSRNLGVSSERAFVGLLLGGIPGFLFGLFTGAIRIAEDLLDRTVQMLRTIPNLALIPLVILWLGIGEETKILLIAMGVFFPLYVNTYQGVRTVDPSLVEMARSYGLRGGALFRHVLLPGALPSVLVGLRFALGSTWLTLISAEALAANSGIGYMTSTAREFMQTDIVLVGVVLYAVLGILADLFTRLLERRLLRWHPNYLPRGVR